MREAALFRSNIPFLLAADIDGTLLGDEAGEAALHALRRDRRADFLLAVISGRSRTSILELVRAGRLPAPDFIGSAVGTELLDYADPHNALGRKYAAQVSGEWDLNKIYALGEGAGIRRQTFAEGQPLYQAGFNWDGQPETLAAFRQRLSAAPDVQILPSANTFIDVFPQPLGKGGLARFLQRALGLDPARVVVAGDSGNDRGMFETEFQGILPCNALDELKATAGQPWHYHSPLPGGRGVLDGLRRLGFVE